jgi:hypothetical protein
MGVRQARRDDCQAKAFRSAKTILGFARSAKSEVHQREISEEEYRAKLRVMQEK